MSKKKKVTKGNIPDDGAEKVEVDEDSNPKAKVPTKRLVASSKIASQGTSSSSTSSSSSESEEEEDESDDASDSKPKAKTRREPIVVPSYAPVRKSKKAIIPELPSLSDSSVDGSDTLEVPKTYEELRVAQGLNTEPDDAAGKKSERRESVTETIDSDGEVVVHDVTVTEGKHVTHTVTQVDSGSPIVLETENDQQDVVNTLKGQVVTQIDGATNLPDVPEAIHDTSMLDLDIVFHDDRSPRWLLNEMLVPRVIPNPPPIEDAVGSLISRATHAVHLAYNGRFPQANTLIPAFMEFIACINSKNNSFDKK